MLPIIRPQRAVAFCTVVLCSSPLLAQTRDVPSNIPIKGLSVEELMDIEVTSVSRAAEHLGDAAAAVAVLTSEDIRRSGATTVPGALRLVPGIHVAQQASSTWAVSSRGFSSTNSEKLLVLTDTRSIYTPLYSGVFWDVQDFLLQDVERIEVIRGPGATQWGSNAVNGVISITTKSAKATQGLYLETSGGTEERGSVGARYGGRIGDRTYYRVFGRYFDRDSTFNTNRVSPDDWQAGHLGFRADSDATGTDTLTFQGDVYDGDIGRLTPSVTIAGRPAPQGRLRVGASGGNVLARWQHSTSKQSALEFRVYYDRTHRNDPSFVDDLHTFDFDFQHRLAVASLQELTWGVNYRFMANKNAGRGIFAVYPPSSRDQIVSGFVQDQISLSSSLRVTLGTKLEHNDFSGAEMQPSSRVAWIVSSNHMVWGAVSRAVRVPTRLERDIAIDASNPSGNPVYRLLGNRAFGSERLLAYEAGYRWHQLKSLSSDLAVFDNQYRDLASLEFDSPVVDPAARRTIIPILNRNLTAGRARGAEALVTYSPVSSSRVSTSYSYLDLRLDPAGQDVNRGRFLDGATPRHQFGLRPTLDLPARFQVDAQFRHLSAIRRMPAIVSGEGLPGYSELDLRLAWGGWRRAEVSVVGQNLLHDHHPEFGPPAARGEIERGVYGKITWGF